MFKKLMCLFAITPLFIVGCKTISYSDDLNRKVTVTSLFSDTDIGDLTIKSSGGSTLTLSSYKNTESQALTTINAAISKIPVAP